MLCFHLAMMHDKAIIVHGGQRPQPAIITPVPVSAEGRPPTDNRLFSSFSGHSKQSERRRRQAPWDNLPVEEIDAGGPAMPRRLSPTTCRYYGPGYGTCAGHAGPGALYNFPRTEPLPPCRHR